MDHKVQKLIDSFCNHIQSFVDKPFEDTEPLWNYAFDHLNIWSSKNVTYKIKQWESSVGEPALINTEHNIKVLCALLENKLKGVFKTLTEVRQSFENNNNNSSSKRKNRDEEEEQRNVKKANKIIEQNQGLFQLLPVDVLHGIADMLFDIDPLSLLKLSETNRRMKEALRTSNAMKFVHSMIFITNVSSKLHGPRVRQNMLLCLHQNNLYHEETNMYTLILDRRGITIPYGLYAACKSDFVKEMAQVLENISKESLKSISLKLFYLISTANGDTESTLATQEAQMQQRMNSNKDYEKMFAEASAVKQVDILKRLYQTVTAVMLPLLTHMKVNAQEDVEPIPPSILDPSLYQRPILMNSRDTRSGKRQWFVALGMEDSRKRMRTLVKLFTLNKATLPILPYNILGQNGMNRASSTHIPVLFGQCKPLHILKKFAKDESTFREKFGDLLPVEPLYNVYYLSKNPLPRPFNSFSEPTLRIEDPISYTVTIMNAISLEQLSDYVRVHKDNLWVKKLWQNSEIGGIQGPTSTTVRKLSDEETESIESNNNNNNSNKGSRRRDENISVLQDIPFAFACSPNEIIIESTTQGEQTTKQFGAYPSIAAILSLITENKMTINPERYDQLAVAVRKMQVYENTSVNNTLFILSNMVIHFSAYLPVYFGKMDLKEIPEVVFYKGYVGLKSQPNTPVSMIMSKLFEHLPSENLIPKLPDIDQEDAEHFADLLTKFDGGFVNVYSENDYNMYYATTLISALCGFNNAVSTFYFHGRVHTLRLSHEEKPRWHNMRIKMGEFSMPASMIKSIIEKKHVPEDGSVEIRNYTTFNFRHVTDSLIKEGIIVKTHKPESITSHIIDGKYRSVLAPLIRPYAHNSRPEEEVQNIELLRVFVDNAVMKGSVIKRYSVEAVLRMSDESNHAYVHSLANKQIITMHPRKTADQVAEYVCSQERREKLQGLIQSYILVHIIGELIYVLPAAVVEDYYNYLTK